MRRIRQSGPFTTCRVIAIKPADSAAVMPVCVTTDQVDHAIAHSRPDRAAQARRGDTTLDRPLFRDCIKYVYLLYCRLIRIATAECTYCINLVAQRHWLKVMNLLRRSADFAPELRHRIVDFNRTYFTPTQQI